MNLATFYSQMKTYLDPTVTGAGYTLHFNHTEVWEKVIILNASKPERSGDRGTSMTRLKLSVFGCSEAGDYDNLHALMESLRTKLHRQRNFLGGYKTSLAFCDSVEDAMPNPSQTRHVAVKDGIQYAMFEADIRVEDSA